MLSSASAGFRSAEEVRDTMAVRPWSFISPSRLGLAEFVLNAILLASITLLVSGVAFWYILGMQRRMGKPFYLVALVVLVILVGISFQLQGRLRQLEQPRTVSDPTTGDETLQEKFRRLSQAKTNACSGAGFISSKTDDERLQGSCCSAMEWHRYQEQVEGLEEFADAPEIPADPYDIPVAQAKKLLAYQKTITLSSEEQEIYNEAMGLSHEGGPCCCRCWRWDAFEGLAKFLISERDFTSEQIAQVWDLEDGCGGASHVPGAHG